MDLRQQRAAVLKTARDTIEKAQAERRNLTESEQAQVEAGFTEVKSLDVKIGQSDLVRNVLGAGSPVGWLDDDGNAPGALFTPSAKAGLIRAIQTRGSYRAEPTAVPWAKAKAAVLGGPLSPPTSSDLVGGGSYGAGVFPLASLFVNAPADGPVMRYYRTGQAVAGIVAEGALKPDAGLNPTAIDLALKKIAVVQQISDELTEDASFLVGGLERELVSAVAVAENAYILSALGAASGIITSTGAAANAIDLAADAIASEEAITGRTPTAIVAAPSVIAGIRKAKAATAGSYFVDPTAPGPSTLHGVALISTAATDPATMWVIEGSGTVIYRRGGLRVDVGLSGDDFTRNLTHLRAEERVGAAVVNPQTIVKVTLT